MMVQVVKLPTVLLCDFSSAAACRPTDSSDP
jgi:hypothetical protein